MGFLDKLLGRRGDLKEKLADAVDQHGDRIGEGVDKAADYIDGRTGGKLGDNADTAADRAKDALDSLDGKDDDIR